MPTLSVYVLSPAGLTLHCKGYVNITFQLVMESGHTCWIDALTRTFWGTGSVGLTPTG